MHSLHWFPGNFIPQIPAYLIQLLSDPGDLVLDPFCGSGTTGVEAIHLGRRAWLSDINHASIQVTCGKIAAVTNPQIGEDLQTILQQLIWDDLLRSDYLGCNNEGGHPDLTRWFHSDTLAQLRYVWTLIESAPYSGLRHLLEVIFTDTLFDCASVNGLPTSSGKRRRHHWGWIADNVLPEKPMWQNAIKLFRDRVFHASEVFQRKEISDPNAVIICREDVRTLSVPSSQVDLIVMSPPYPGMIDYALANRLTYSWMGWPLEEDRNKEIGARYRRKKVRAMDEYLEAMAEAARHIVRSLRDGGYCAIVIGASRRYPAAVARVIELFRRELRIVWGPKGRTPTRRRVSDRQGSAPVEWLCILRKSTSS